MYRNTIVVDQLHERGEITFLLVWSCMLHCSTVFRLVGTIMPDPATGRQSCLALLINVARALRACGLDDNDDEGGKYRMCKEGFEPSIQRAVVLIVLDFEFHNTASLS